VWSVEVLKASVAAIGWNVKEGVAPLLVVSNETGERRLYCNRPGSLVEQGGVSLRGPSTLLCWL